MGIKAGNLAYIGKSKVKYKPTGPAHNFKKADESVPFLWGDAVYVISTNRRTTKISAKGHKFSVPTRDLMENGLLCLWQIDCGQGDAAFMRFPNGKTMMIDGGPGPLMTNAPAMAPAFLKWMRFVDQSWRGEFQFDTPNFHIDALVCSHPDYDHFGGFLDMVGDIKSNVFTVGNVYHGGLGRYNTTASGLRNKKGLSQLGVVEGAGSPDLYVTTLIDDFQDVDRMAKTARGRPWKLNGSYGQWLRDLSSLKGKGVGSLQRVHAGMGALPGFDSGSCRVTLLGPIEESFRGKPALRYIDGESKSSMSKPSLTRNGISIVQRIDIGDVRILMTGDLNFRSQALLLKHIPVGEFKCHVAKACHHGSEDVSSTFLRAMSPLATLFSSGDNETHAHPRAKVLGMAGALTSPIGGRRKIKFLGLEEEEYAAPLIYSTELSRSVNLFKPGKVSVNDEVVRGADLSSIGAGNRKGPTKKLSEWYLADSLIYGLINVRTDGEKVVIGALKEGEGAGFQIESFKV